MTDFRVSEDGFSLTKAVEDVSQHSFTQAEALKEKQKTLSSLQATLSDVQKKAEMAEQELRSRVRDTLVLEGNVEHLQRQTKVLQDRCVSINKENTQLHIRICEQEENACTALAGFDTYRQKMEGHAAAVLRVASQTEAFKELEEKRALVRMLTLKKEELREDLESSNGNTAHLAKRETKALKGEVSLMRRIIAKQRERLQKEFETHTQMKKDIEIQNRRYEAIVKRLHCQLSRAQAAHRQMCEDIYHMERQLAELKKQRESSQGSVASKL
ncbi:coiled-coil domain-containing protein 122-like [Hippoglossus hippoglossus]|uniref:coiled-coil domain-containing protein 122-like n=1 Tax=Hippoglossus hippoglossus TaxID=8267 RepID=UPI00148B42BB|nr:coiled-coil domain-containing protein 122-like [Hippoglossus hippoglossus]